MKKLLVTLSSVVVVVALFTVAAYGSDWLNFNGDGQLDQSAADVDEILSILEQVHTDKMSTAEALEELRAMDPHGLLAENGELKEQVENLETDIVGLTEEKEDLLQANAVLTTDLANKNSVITEKNTEISNLQSTVNNLNDSVAGLEADVRTHTKTISQQDTQIKNLTDANSDLTNENTNLENELAAEKADNSENNKYITHLEGQLEIGNTKVAEHSTKTENAVKQARTYINSAE